MYITEKKTIAAADHMPTRRSLVVQVLTKPSYNRLSEALK